MAARRWKSGRGKVTPWGVREEALMGLYPVWVPRSVHVLMASRLAAGLCGACCMPACRRHVACRASKPACRSDQRPVPMLQPSQPRPPAVPAPTLTAPPTLSPARSFMLPMKFESCATGGSAGAQALGRYGSQPVRRQPHALPRPCQRRRKGSVTPSGVEAVLLVPARQRMHDTHLRPPAASTVQCPLASHPLAGAGSLSPVPTSSSVQDT